MSLTDVDNKRVAMQTAIDDYKANVGSESHKTAAQQAARDYALECAATRAADPTISDNSFFSANVATKSALRDKVRADVCERTPLILTIDTEAGGSAPGNATFQFHAATVNGVPSRYTIDWGQAGFGQYQRIDSDVDGSPSKTYIAPGIYTIKVYGVIAGWDNTLMTGTNAGVITDLTQWGTGCYILDHQNMFRDMQNIQISATDGPNFSYGKQMNNMFSGCSNFNSNINHWDVSPVTALSRVFAAATVYNQPLDSWDVSNVTLFMFTFLNASSFNQPLDTWNTSKATATAGMFYGAASFNQPVADGRTSYWDMSKVISARWMFRDAVAFNQDISALDFSSAIRMDEMLLNATAYDQDLTGFAQPAYPDLDYTNFVSGAPLMTTAKLPTWMDATTAAAADA